jgi:hypothetical protein
VFSRAAPPFGGLLRGYALSLTSIIVAMLAVPSVLYVTVNWLPRIVARPATVFWLPERGPLEAARRDRPETARYDQLVRPRASQVRRTA